MLRLRREVVAGLDTQAGLRTAMQTAIELEHSTIPPYLYALYSIEPGTNAEIAGLIRSVVIEEMVHMAFGCNILNALGGAPVIGVRGFVPAYPGPLPGAVDEGLQVSLKKLSLEHVHDTFMAIEEPEDPLNFPVARDVEDPHVTIGEFYARLRAQMPGASFPGDRARQVTHEMLPDLFAITDADAAIAAIDLIVGQGEGTQTSPLDGDHGDLAHYYRFAEIFHGRRLVPQPEPGLPPDRQYAYSGDPIVLDPAGVRDVIDNPRRSSFEANSYALHLFDNFNYTYTSLLKSLHTTFNAGPGGLDGAIGLMESCKQQALALTAVALPAGRVAGPGFLWQPTNP
jgi:Ferritin-like